MPKRPTAGTMQFGAELNTNVVLAYRAFCARRGGIRYCTELAMQRFMEDLANAPAEVPEAPDPKPVRPKGK
jgi:hypothetical protein